MKALVETISNTILMDPLTGDLVEWNRPSVVSWSSYMEGRAGARQIRVLSPHLRDETTDQDYVDNLKACDGKAELALESFLSVFAVVEEPLSKVEATLIEPKVDIAPVTELIGEKKGGK